MRQNPVIQANDEDHLEFEPFGGVQGQQGGGVIAFGQGILVGDERHRFKEIGQAAVLVFGGQPAQLLDVFPAFGAFFGAVVNVLPVLDILGDAVE